MSVFLPRDREVASGIANLGNTCYANAVLQSLAHAPELCNALELAPHCLTCPITRPRRDTTVASDSIHNNASTANPNGGDDGSGFCVLCEVERIISSIHQIGSASNTASDNNPPTASSAATAPSVVSPTRFIDGFTSVIAPWFRKGLQEDSHEFLRLLTDGMQKSCIRAASIRKAEAGKSRMKENNGAATQSMNRETNLTPPLDQSTNENDKEAMEQPTAKQEQLKEEEEKEDNVESSYPFQLFRGQIESIVTCFACHETNRTVDPMEDLGLECVMDSTSAGGTPPALGSITVSLEKFIQEEKLECYKCEKCHKIGHATKKSKLASIPPILTLHLKRFRYGLPGADRSGAFFSGGTNGGLSLALTGRTGSNKIEGHVKFDTIFDIGPYLTDDCLAQMTPDRKKVKKSAFCRLFAVVVHTGANSHSGHYYSIVRNMAKNEWWKMDDGTIRKVSTNQVMEAHAYMLFYRVVEHPVSLHLRDEVQRKRDAMTAEVKVAAEVEVEATVEEQEYPKEDVTMDEEQQASESVSEAVTTTKSPDEALDAPKKRKRPTFTESDAWAQKRTRIPPEKMHLLRQAQTWISEHVDFKPEYFKLLVDESKGIEKVGSGRASGVAEDDVKNGCNAFRRAIKHLLHRIVAPNNNPQDCSMLKPIDDGDVGDGFVDHGNELSEEMLSSTSTAKVDKDNHESINILPIVEADDAVL